MLNISNRRRRQVWYQANFSSGYKYLSFEPWMSFWSPILPERRLLALFGEADPTLSRVRKPIMTQESDIERALTAALWESWQDWLIRIWAGLQTGAGRRRGGGFSGGGCGDGGSTATEAARPWTGHGEVEGEAKNCSSWWMEWAALGYLLLVVDF